MGLLKSLAKAALKAAESAAAAQQASSSSSYANVPMGGAVTLEEKETYCSSLGGRTTAICAQAGLRAPLEVYKRGDNGTGLSVGYFADDRHMEEYCGKVLAVSPATREAIITKLFQLQSEGIADVRIEGSVPVQVVSVYHSYDNFWGRHLHTMSTACRTISLASDLL